MADLYAVVKRHMDARGSGSARLRAELHALRQRMEPWRGGQRWRDLKDTLRALPRAGKAG